MKKIILFALLVLDLFASSPSALSFVDAKKFSGLWYEMARTYNSYQKECVASSVEYLLQDDGTYDVNNRCFKNVIGGKLIEYNGTAKSEQGSSMSHLKMRYFFVFARSYKVVYLGEDYKTAVVCDKDMDQVWIMSRTPRLAPQKLDQILTFLDKYMDTKKFIITPQDPQGRYK